MQKIFLPTMHSKRSLQGSETNSLIFILEAEFVVVRRESFGQVAKEHTQKIMKESVNKNAWQHQSTIDYGSGPIENNSVSSRSGSVQRDTNLEFSQRFKKQNTEKSQKNLDFQVEKSIGGISFGDKANPLDNSTKTYQEDLRPPSYSDIKAAGQRPSLHNSANVSAISVRDIAEIQDKVPASPISPAPSHMDQ